MGFSYRKSIKLPGGIRLNASKRGLSASGGVRGVRYSSRSGLRFTLPGTGLSWRPSRRRR